MNLFLNELSIGLWADYETAKYNMALFVACFKQARNEYGIGDLKVHSGFLDAPICNGRTISNWLDDDSVDRDSRELLRLFACNTPFFDELLDDKQNAVSPQRLYDFYFEDSACIGLGLASPMLYDTLALSFDTETWSQTEIKISINWLADDDSLTQESESLVRHISSGSHLKHHKAWFDSIQKIQIHSPQELWILRTSLFPKLDFCPEVRRQLLSLSPSSAEFNQILKRLDELNRACENWTSVFEYEKLSKATPESTTREREYKQKLTILCADGEFRFFSWHLRYTPGAGRIHFNVDERLKKIHIGYIGLKIL